MLTDEKKYLDLLEDVWAQFACPVPGRLGVHHDGGLSVLEEIREILVASRRLKSADIEGKDWWVRPTSIADLCAELARSTR